MWLLIRHLGFSNSGCWPCDNQGFRALRCKYRVLNGEVLRLWYLGLWIEIHLLSKSTSPGNSICLFDCRYLSIDPST